jgi:hypothetical protein
MLEDDPVDPHGSRFSHGESIGPSDPNASSRPRTVKSPFTLLREALNASDIQAARRLLDELERLTDHDVKLCRPDQVQ